jgi:hypothetical protein
MVLPAAPLQCGASSVSPTKRGYLYRDSRGFYRATSNPLHSDETVAEYGTLRKAREIAGIFNNRLRGRLH